MDWLIVIGFVALLSLILSVVFIVLTLRKRIEPLPDGDYLVTIVETRETPRGVATVFKIDEPKEFEGHTVTVVKEKTEELLEGEVNG